MRFKLTNSSVAKRCLPPDPAHVNGNGKPVLQRVYWDTELKGFGLVASRTAKSWVVQKDLHGRSVRVTIGRYPKWTPDQARKQARDYLVQMDKGINPNQEKRKKAARGVTLSEAMEMHVAAMRSKGNAEKSIKNVQDEIDRHLSDWLRRPLGEITPNACAERHARITRKSGPYAANRVFRCFRACYNTARKRHHILPENPVVGVTFNRMKRRREPIPWADLPDWYATVRGLGNPVRRDLNLFILLTGLRSEDARTVRWEHIDFAKGTLHRPKPKGGEDRAFTIPLCRFLRKLLWKRKRHNPQVVLDDQGWVFPTYNKAGQVTHVQEAKEQRYYEDENGKTRKEIILPSPHRLRDTFATAAHEARLHPLDLKVLMNHTLPGGGSDVTEGYIRPSVDHLRDAAECISCFLRQRMGRTCDN